MQRKVNETKSLFFEKFNKVDKPTPRLTKKEEKKHTLIIAYETTKKFKNT